VGEKGIAKGGGSTPLSMGERNQARANGREVFTYYFFECRCQDNLGRKILNASGVGCDAEETNNNVEYEGDGVSGD